MVISGFDLILSVIYREKISLSTASAPPAATRLMSAASIISEPNSRISSFKSPQAFSMRSAFNEFEQTNSAKFSLLCAGEYFSGFISQSSTSIPRPANCQAASQPASPAPITLTFIFFAWLSFIFAIFVQAIYFAASAVLFKEQAAALRTLFLKRHIPRHKVALRQLLAGVVCLALS